MLETYKAILSGNQIKWSGEIPDIVQEETEIEIFITILTKDAQVQKPRPFGLCKNEFTVPKILTRRCPKKFSPVLKNEITSRHTYFSLVY